MLNQYNPFNKRLDEIKEADLEILRNISEGQFIEYKGQKPVGKKIAKSISSFANSHGGLYFLGVEADSSTNLPTNFVGVDDSPDVIRDSIVNNLQPFPIFQTYQISLSNKKKIIMVNIPEGDNLPYIHSDGKIYRRQEGGSDPIVPETNRYAIDELYKKANNYLQEIEKFRKNEFGFSKIESESPHLIIYINPSPFKRFLLDDFRGWNENKILTFFKKESKLNFKQGTTNLNLSFNIPFDTFSTYSNSFSIRQMKGRDLSYNGLTVEIDVFGNCRILLPLGLYEFKNRDSLVNRYNKVINEYDGESLSHLKILDGSQIGHVILTILNLYKEFLLDRDFGNDLEIKLELLNCHRTTVYFACEEFLEHIENFGLPICMKEDQYFPKTPFLWKNTEIEKNSLMDCMSIFSLVIMALGVPSTISSKSYIYSLSFQQASSQSPSQNQPSSVESDSSNE